MVNVLLLERYRGGQRLSVAPLCSICLAYCQCHPDGRLERDPLRLRTGCGEPLTSRGMADARHCLWGFASCARTLGTWDTVGGRGAHRASGCPRFGARRLHRFAARQLQLVLELGASSLRACILAPGCLMLANSSSVVRAYVARVHVFKSRERLCACSYSVFVWYIVCRPACMEAPYIPMAVRDASPRGLAVFIACMRGFASPVLFDWNRRMSACRPPFVFHLEGVQYIVASCRLSSALPSPFSLPL
jgi:hypothetical protein